VGSRYCVSLSELCAKLQLRLKQLLRNIILNDVRQHNHFITQVIISLCFYYKLVILRPILLIVSQDAMHNLGSHRVYTHGIHQIKSFASKGVTSRP